MLPLNTNGNPNDTDHIEPRRIVLIKIHRLTSANIVAMRFSETHHFPLRRKRKRIREKESFACMFSLITETEQRNSIVFPVSDAQIWKCHLRKIHLFEPARRTPKLFCVYSLRVFWSKILCEKYTTLTLSSNRRRIYTKSREKERESEREEGTERETK